MGRAGSASRSSGASCNRHHSAQAVAGHRDKFVIGDLQRTSGRSDGAFGDDCCQCDHLSPFKVARRPEKFPAPLFLNSEAGARQGGHGRTGCGTYIMQSLFSVMLLMAVCYASLRRCGDARSEVLGVILVVHACSKPRIHAAVLYCMTILCRA